MGSLARVGFLGTCLTFMLGAEAECQPIARSESTSMAPFPRYVVRYTDTTPTVDGTLDDRVWSISDFVTLCWTSEGDSLRGPQKTRAWAVRDAQHLYFAFYCPETSPSQLRSAGTRDEPAVAVRSDDIEIFLQPGDMWGASFFQIAVNPANSVLTVWHHGLAMPPSEDVALLALAYLPPESWNPATLSSGTQVASDHWSCEVAIAFRDLPTPPPTVATEWGANFARHVTPRAWRGASNQLLTKLYNDDDLWVAWSPSGESFLLPQRFGVVRLESNRDP